MPDEQATVMDADKLEQDLEAAATGLQDEPAPTPDEGDAGDKDTDPYAGKSDEEIRAALRERDKQYQSLRSMEDRRYGKLQEQLVDTQRQMAKILEVATKRSDVPSTDAVRQLQESQMRFNDEWAEKIEREPGKATVAYMQAALGEMIERFNALMSEKVSGLDGTLNQRLMSLDPVYRSNQKQIDEMSEEFGLSRDKAISLFKKLNPAASGKPKSAVSAVPGRTADGGRSVSGKGPKPSPLVLDGTQAQIMKMIGLDGDALARVLQKTADELSGEES
jgi:hypothetical protein